MEDQEVPRQCLGCSPPVTGPQSLGSSSGPGYLGRVLQGDGHETCHIAFTMSYAKPFARIVSFNTHLILRGWFYYHQPTHFMCKERRLRDIQVMVQDHSVTKQHPDSNHSFSLIPHMLKHHSMTSCFFILRDKAELGFSNKTIRFFLCLSRLPF